MHVVWESKVEAKKVLSSYILRKWDPMEASTIPG